MRTIRLGLYIPHKPASEIYAALADFGRYPELCDAVRDVAVFDGSWQCLDAPQGSEIVFAATLDMGIPSLADALEPIAVRALTDNIVSIVRGLIGHAELVASDVAVPAPVPVASAS